MLEPHPVWTTLGLVKLLFSDENSRHFYMRFTPGKPPTSAIHFSTLSVYTRSYTQRLEKKSSKKATYQLVEIKCHCQYCSKASNQDRGPHWCVGSVT